MLWFNWKYNMHVFSKNFSDFDWKQKKKIIAKVHYMHDKGMLENMSEILVLMK